MFVDPQVVLEANSLHIRGKFLMKDSHKVCKTTQNFVKKKLKAFPTRLDIIIYRTRLVLLINRVVIPPPLENYWGWSELLGDLTRWLYRSCRTFRSNRRVR